jgi:hypothetical protein
MTGIRLYFSKPVTITGAEVCIQSLRLQLTCGLNKLVGFTDLRVMMCCSAGRSHSCDCPKTTGKRCPETTYTLCFTCWETSHSVPSTQSRAVEGAVHSAGATCIVLNCLSLYSECVLQTAPGVRPSRCMWRSCFQMLDVAVFNN